MHRMSAIARHFLLTLAVILLAFGAICGFMTSTVSESAPVSRPLVIFALDASTSMLAASEGDSRLDQSRKSIVELADAFHDADLALVTFGGDALVDFPPSPDREGFLGALDAVKPTLSFSPGSDATTGLALAQELSAGRQAVAVLFTDGEFNVPDQNLLRTTWMSRTIPLAWRVVGMGPAMPIPLGGSWFRDPDSGEIALSQASDETLKELVALSDVPSVLLLPKQPTSACAAAISELLSSKDAQPSHVASRLTPSIRVCSVIAAVLILFAMVLGHFSHLPAAVYAVLLTAIVCASCAQEKDHSLKQAERLTVFAIQEWKLADAANEASESLVHIRRGLALCREVVRLVPQDEKAAVNLRLFLTREAQLCAPQDEAPDSVNQSSMAAGQGHSLTENSRDGQSSAKQTETIADDVLGLAGDAVPARMMPDELRGKSQTPSKSAHFTPQDGSTADAWRSLMQKEHGMRKRPPNVKPW